MNERHRIKYLSWKHSWKKYKARYPHLDRESFIKGFIACINALEKDLSDQAKNQSKIKKEQEEK